MAVTSRRVRLRELLICSTFAGAFVALWPGYAAQLCGLRFIAVPFGVAALFGSRLAPHAARLEHSLTGAAVGLVIVHDIWQIASESGALAVLVLPILVSVGAASGVVGWWWGASSAGPQRDACADDGARRTPA